MAKNYHFSRKHFNFSQIERRWRYIFFLRSFSTFFQLMIRSTGEVYPPISTDGEIHPLFSHMAKYIHFFPVQKRFHISSKTNFNQIYANDVFPLWRSLSTYIWRNISTFFLSKKVYILAEKTNYNYILLLIQRKMIHFLQRISTW